MERDTEEVSTKPPQLPVVVGRESMVPAKQALPSQSPGSRQRLMSALKPIFSKAVRPSILFVFLLTAIVIGYLPASVIDDPWSRFQVFQRELLWFLRTTAVRSIVGPLLLFVGYGLFYRLWLGRRKFIVVAKFRIWANAKEKEKFPDQGVEARLRDELKRLWGELRVLREESVAVPGDVSDSETESLGSGEIQLQGDLSLPEANVTLQYEGISPEAVHTFIRQFTEVETVITGDLIIDSKGLKLIARTNHDGPWEITVEVDAASEVVTTQVIERESWKILVESDSEALQVGLKRMAFMIITRIVPKFQTKPETAYALLQIKARRDGENDLALHLAKLGLQAARAGGRDDTMVKQNLATAYNDKGVELIRTAYDDKGVELIRKENCEPALRKFVRAVELDPEFDQAYKNAKQAAGLVEPESIGTEAMRRVDEVRGRRQKSA